MAFEVNGQGVGAAAQSAGRLRLCTSADIARIWRAGRFRLFVSHSSRVRTSGELLKAAFASYGIDAFIAHEDVEPAPEWADEIVLALRSMHALCAIVTPEFHASRWCEQEAGFALGRPVPVISVRLGAEPSGFLRQLPVIEGADDADLVAKSVFGALVKLESCRALLRKG
jgi:hypothetical protein